ncbi:sugar transporter [Peziza echinospora]|nr:sugar transporter [Peziza echinospora]
MGAPAASTGAAEALAMARRKALAGPSGPAGLLQNGRVFGIACFACLGGLLYGYNQGVFSGVLAMEAFKKDLGDNVSDAGKKGWLTAILELGAWAGTLYTPILAEKLSRKYTILINVAIFIIGVIVQVCAVTAGDSSAAARFILGGRFVTGLGVGSLSMTVPMYNAEVAPPEVRGSLVGLQQFAITFGIMISFWIDYGTNYIGGTGEGQKDAAWLLPLALQLFPAVVLGVGMLFMPFSPRWLIHHDRDPEALKILATLRGLPEDHDLITLEYLEIKSQSLFEKRTEALRFPQHDRSDGTWWTYIVLEGKSFTTLFSSWPMGKRVMVATVTMFFQQFTGINAVLYYAPSIFEQLGLSGKTTSLLATGVVGVVMFIATIPAVLWIDSVGRKPVLIVGAIGMAFCHYTIAVLFAQNSHDWPSNIASGWAAVAMVWLFVVHFGYSWGPCAWIIVAEIWPMSVRAKGIALGASSNWMNNFIIGQVTPKMLEKLEWGTYVFFGTITVCGALFIYFLVPETKQLSLEEMDTVFGSTGVTAGDLERMAAIHQEIGLDAALAGLDANIEKDRKEKHDALELEGPGHAAPEEKEISEKASS